MKLDGRAPKVNGAAHAKHVMTVFKTTGKPTLTAVVPNVRDVLAMRKQPVNWNVLIHTMNAVSTTQLELPDATVLTV